MNCPLCASTGGREVWRNERFRIVHAMEAGFPAFYRVIANTHVAEWTDLDAAARAECMQLVEAVETALRKVLQPTKINLASLGNAVPHVHWHVVARFDWDTHFPGSVWAASQRVEDAARIAQILALLPAVEADLLLRLQTSRW